MKKQALFRFEASPLMGAGHAIRSCVLADALAEKGWNCKIITTSETYKFIEGLKRFERIDPEHFYHNPLLCDLLVIDNYELDHIYEKHFRSFAQKIMVIDDLANRKHECDILLDQTYHRESSDYKNLVPATCKILTGSDYVLLRQEFIKLRPKALEKRRKTKDVKRILVSMGGADPENFTLKALQMIKESGFNGFVDIILGFSSQNFEAIQNYVNECPNISTIHVNADMSQLIFDGDLAIGAGGTSVWERYCLGLPSVLIVMAANQEKIYESLLLSGNIALLNDSLSQGRLEHFNEVSSKLIDGFGINRVLLEIENDNFDKKITLRKVTENDKDTLFYWQNIPEIRRHFNRKSLPSYTEHGAWFEQRLKQPENPFWIICEENQDIGALSLTYNHSNDFYDLSWYVIPEKWGKGIGTNALNHALEMVRPFKIHAFVKEENVQSHRSLQKLGFKTEDNHNYFSENFDTNKKCLRK